MELFLSHCVGFLEWRKLVTGIVRDHEPGELIPRMRLIIAVAGMKSIDIARVVAMGLRRQRRRKADKLTWVVMEKCRNQGREKMVVEGKGGLT